MSDEGSTLTVAHAFFHQEQKWDDHNYPYWQNVTMWDDHIKAVDHIDSLPVYRRKPKRRVALKHLVVLQSGETRWEERKVVWEDGKWVSPEHDPRAEDPDYRTYLRLKERFENADD